MDLTCSLKAERGSGDLSDFNLSVSPEAGEKYLKMLNILFANTKKCLRALDNVFHFAVETWFMPRSDCGVFVSSDTAPPLATQSGLPLINAISRIKSVARDKWKTISKQVERQKMNKRFEPALHKPTTRRTHKTNRAAGHTDKRFIAFQPGSI